MIQDNHMNRELSFTPEGDGKHVLFSFPFNRQVVNILKVLHKKNAKTIVTKVNGKLNQLPLIVLRKKLRN